MSRRNSGSFCEFKLGSDQTPVIHLWPYSVPSAKIIEPLQGLPID